MDISNRACLFFVVRIASPAAAGLAASQLQLRQEPVFNSCHADPCLPYEQLCGCCLWVCNLLTVVSYYVLLAAAIAVPAAVAGAVVALVVSKLFGWLQRRRQRRYQEQTGSEYYEEEVYGTDSAQDDASAYDD